VWGDGATDGAVVLAEMLVWPAATLFRLGVGLYFTPTVRSDERDAPMKLQYCFGEVRIALVAMLAMIPLCGCGAKKTATVPALPQAPATQPSASTGPQWSEVFTPFPAADITAVGNVFWVCGVDEMIASSSDGGNSWKLKQGDGG
jgi:hypothetical protein